MGRLCHCHAIIMCIVIFSGMKESDALNVNYDIGGKNDDTVNEAGGSHIGSSRGSRSNVGSTSHDFNNTIDKGYNKKFPKICQKAPETGVCKAYIPTWYFDLWDEVCKIFIYGGCGGNENQFESEKKCQRKCLPLRRRRPVCGEKMKTTKCRHPKLTWYFNADKGTCHKIGEGKCGIRPNAFPSCKVCMKRCSRLTSDSTQHQNGDNAPSSRGIGKQDTNEGGLTFGLPHPGPVSWRHPTKPRKRLSLCKEPPEKGVCRAFIPSWYFDFEQELCKIFIYGGCGGNENNFKSEKKCQDICLPGKPSKRVCSLEPRSAKGGLLCRRWYFDANFGTCSRFPKHQCATNANGFFSCIKCMKRCSSLKTEEICRLAHQSTEAPRIQQQQSANHSSQEFAGPRSSAE